MDNSAELECFVRDYNIRQLKALSDKLQLRLEMNQENFKSFAEPFSEFKNYVENKINLVDSLGCSNKTIDDNIDENIDNNLDLVFKYLNREREKNNSICYYLPNLLIERFFLNSKNIEADEKRAKCLEEAEEISKAEEFNNSLNGSINLQMINLLRFNMQESLDWQITYLLKGVGYSQNAVSSLIFNIIKKRNFNLHLCRKMETQIKLLEKYFKIYKSLNYNLNISGRASTNLQENLQEEVYKSALVINMCCYGLNAIMHKLNSKSFSLNTDFVNFENVAKDYENELDRIEKNLKELTEAAYSEMEKHKTELRAIIKNKISYLEEHHNSENQGKLKFYLKIKKAFEYAVKTDKQVIERK
ncbi:MAG: hypothetical protein ACP5OZ_04005 [Candidatus Woesearchaeota archaeon]